MQGHERLVSMRLAGYVPACVWIDTDGPDALESHADWHEIDNRHARIAIGRNERASRLDLRFLTRLLCVVDGTDLSRVREIRDACIAAGASRVLAISLLEMTDTAGQFVQRADSNG